MSRKWFAKACALLLIFGLVAGCAGRGQPQTPAPGGGAAPAPAGANFKVGMVTDTGGLNDESFNAAAWAGLQRAKSELGYQVQAVESHRQEEYETNFQTLSDQKFNLIWGVGMLLGDPIKRMAPRLANQQLGIVDNVVNEPNVASVMFREEEGSFLMGVIAARTSKTKKVGFIGGMAIDVIQHFEAGFKAGVKAVDPAVDVITVYSGTFTDPGKGKSDALAVIGRGADVVFHAAGNTGVGVIDAARESNKFAIGVDRDQNPLAPNNVISSMLKRVDVAVYDISKNAQAGNFPGGKTTELGLKEDGVGYSPTTLWDRMPPGTRELVDRWAAAIKAGTVTVPNTLEKLRTWTVPTI